jgi:Tetratricopeptide repeat
VGGMSPPMSSTEELTMADLDVAPFDITELNLDIDEMGTGLLHAESIETGLLRSDLDFPPGTIPEAPYARPHERVFTNTLFSKPKGQGQGAPPGAGTLPAGAGTGPAAPTEPPGHWEAPKWMGADQGSGTGPTAEPIPGKAHDLETTRLQGVASAAPTQMHTGPQSAPVDDPDNIFKVRVSRFKSVRSGPLDGPGPSGSPERGSGTAPTSDPSPDPQPPTPGQTRDLQPPVARDTQPGALSATGPLPMVQGFEQLEKMVKEKPDDLGAHMALAVAYAQAGYMEHAMHEYGRLLKNRQVPAPMLQLISDLLSDVEDEATGSVRFHQARGDLYMKQGRYQEAIEEYNKIK